MITITVKNKKAVYAILIAFILIPAIIGTVLLVKNQENTQGYVKTNATVVDYRYKKEYDHEEMREKIFYQEIVEYTVDGKTYSATSDVWTTNPKGRGGKFKIAYDPDYPSRCVFVVNSYIWIIICYGLSIVGVILLIVKIVGDIKGQSN